MPGSLQGAVVNRINFNTNGLPKTFGLFYAKFAQPRVVAALKPMLKIAFRFSMANQQYSCYKCQFSFLKKYHYAPLV